MYIIDDYYNFYKQYLSSQIGIKGDTITVYGKSMTDRFNTVVIPGLNGLNMLDKHIRPKRLLILGGEPTVDKFFMIQSSLGLYENTFLTGKLGIAFLMVKRGFQKCFGFTLSTNQINAITQL